MSVRVFQRLGPNSGVSYGPFIGTLVLILYLSIAVFAVLAAAVVLAVVGVVALVRRQGA